MTGPLIEKLLAEQARQQAALDRILRTVARWAGLPVEEEEQQQPTATRSPLGHEAAPHKPGPATKPDARDSQPGLPSAATPAGTATASASADHSAAPASQERSLDPLPGPGPAVPPPADGWRPDLPPPRSARAATESGLAASAEQRRSPDSPAREASADAPAPTPGQARAWRPAAANSRAEASLWRLQRLRPGRRSLPSASLDPSHAAPPACAALPAHAHLSASRPAAAGAAPSAPDQRFAAQTPAACPSASAPFPDQASQAAPWGRSPGAAAPVSAAASGADRPRPAATVTDPGPTHAAQRDTFPESALEEAMADALERAALEAGIDLA